MEWICLWELSGLEKVTVAAIAIAALVFLYIGLSMVFQKELWEVRLSKIKYKEWSLGLPAPLAVVALAIALAAADVGWLYEHFPSNNFSFGQKEWTLAEVRERLQHDSRVRIELQGNAAQFRLDKTRNFAGACVADVIDGICQAYPAQLRCDRPDSTSVIINTK
jgi:hypothetical protein